MFASIEEIRESQRGLGFAHAARSHQHEHAHRLVGIIERGARGLHALRDDLHRVRLADDALAQVILQREHRRDFVLQHLACRNPGPRGQHFADDLRIDADADQASFAL